MAVSTRLAVKTAGRTDIAEFFQLSGYFRPSVRWKHHPLLAFVSSKNGLEVLMFRRLTEIPTDLADDTPCMMQWGGEWSSDFFQFKLGELRAWLSNQR